MKESFQIPASDPEYLARRVEELHAALREANPTVLQAQTGATYLQFGPAKGTFYLPYWGRDVSLTYPEFVGRDVHNGALLNVFTQALLAYYFTLADGTPQTGKWISFSELPDGKFYTQAFQSYTGHKLLDVMGSDEVGFARAAAQTSGRRLEAVSSPGDMSYHYQVLPLVSLLVVYWLGDEDFPPSYRILFDAAAGHHLSTDACAIVGSTLTKKLVTAYRELGEQSTPPFPPPQPGSSRSIQDEDRR